jgi:UDP-4-amino-4,6-dideoxy-N-acetyl-beta-L-altrosamine N-acetyltransferase
MYLNKEPTMISYEGKKTKLRPIRKSDIEKSIRWRNNPDIRDNSLGYRFPVTEKKEEKWYESAMDDQSHSKVVFAIETIEDNNFIGFIHLNQIDWISRRCHFGITIGEKEYQGKGMGPDSMQILFNYAFNCLNIRKISLEVVSFNTHAIRLYKNFGFIEEGKLEEHLYLEGAYHDIIQMRIFDSDFREKYMSA